MLLASAACGVSHCCSLAVLQCRCCMCTGAAIVRHLKMHDWCVVLVFVAVTNEQKCCVQLSTRQTSGIMLMLTARDMLTTSRI